MISLHDGHWLHGVDRRALRAVQALGQNPRRRGLSHAPRAGEQIRMPGAVEFDRVLECLNYRLLADNFAKDLGAELPCYDLIFH